MNILHLLVNEPVLRRLGWTLLHSVWQCAVIAVLLAVVLSLLRRSSARYLVSCAALLAAAAAPAATYVLLARPPGAQPAISHFIVPAAPVQPAAGLGLDLTTRPTIDPLHASLPGAAIVWLAGVVLLCARHVGGWIAVHQLRRNARTIESHRGFDRLLSRLRIRAIVRLAQSTRVSVPSVIGWLRPTIVIPCSALTGLSPIHLDALLAHELAHIRRRDYLVNLIQLAIETLLFYHPAVWWISRQIRQEREHCCDDIAVQATVDRRGYVEALAAMETLRISSGSLALASNGGSLLRRVQRLVTPHTQRASAVWPVLLMLTIVFTLAACNQVMTPAVKAQEPSEAAAPTIPPPPVPPVEPVPPPAPAASRANPFTDALAAERATLYVESQRQIAAQEAELAKLQAELAQGHPSLRRAEAQLQAARDRYSELTAKYEFAQVRAEPSAYYISGVRASGPVAISHGGTTPLHAALEAGGIDQAADKYVVVVRQRAPRAVRKIEILKMTEALDPNRDVEPIRGGDVIMITDKPSPELQAEALGPHVVVEGVGANPVHVPWHSGMTLLQAVVAGGVNPLDAGPGVVTVHSKPVSRQFKIATLVSEGGSTELRPGERIVVGEPRESR
jgi:beta-lactamase regulating signal transducer with metallopeptidase domain/protein involved in polysaccharide export with SLBB domain